MRAASDDTVDAPAILARQGIYDARLRLVGYELLFRPMSNTGVQLRDADAATAQVLLTAFSDIGLDKLVGARQAFVNVPYAFLTDGFCGSLPPDRVVLEILEDVQVDDQVVDVARKLVAAGYRLALDDFVFRDGIEPLLDLAQIVKLDVLALNANDLDEHVARLASYDVTLLAEKVEHADQIGALREKGFKYFQGYALQRPTTIRARATQVNRTVLVQILARLHEPKITPADLVDTISRDPSIVYALLRILNSAQVSLLKKVTSLDQAVVLLGIDGLRNWTTMMIMSRLAPDSHHLIANTLIRAKMCELCAPRHTRTDPAVAFTAGVLSALPDILGRRLPDIVEELGLASELQTAILDYHGPIGQVLAWVLAYETQDPHQLAGLNAPPTIANAFIEAVRWSTQLTTALAISKP